MKLLIIYCNNGIPVLISTGRSTFWLGNANSSKNAIIRQKRPIASDNANPNIAYENNCCFKDEFRAYPNIKLPNTIPIPIPEKHQLLLK